MHKDRRKDKRYLNHLRSKLKYGMFVEDCRSHPCMVTGHDLEGFDCVSLVNGKPNSCSILNCGPIPLTKAEAYERADYMKQHGMEAYLVKYQGFTEEALEYWRKLDAEWNFDKGT